MVTQTTLLPAAPQRADGRDDFSDDADTFAAALALYQTQANQQALDVNALAVQAAASALAATNAPATPGTSTTSLTIANGLQTLSTQTGKNFVSGQWVTLTRTSDTSKWMLGIASYNSTTGAMTVTVTATGGSGTFTDWTITPSAPLLLTAATAAQVWAGALATSALTPASLFASAAPQLLTDAATITPDFGAGLNYYCTLGGSRTLANPSSPKVGQSGIIAVTQDGTGARALAFGGYWKFPGGTPSLSVTPGAIDLISYFVLTPTVILCTLTRAFS